MKINLFSREVAGGCIFPLILAGGLLATWMTSEPYKPYTRVFHGDYKGGTARVYREQDREVVEIEYTQNRMRLKGTGHGSGGIFDEIAGVVSGIPAVAHMGSGGYFIGGKRVEEGSQEAKHIEWATNELKNAKRAVEEQNWNQKK